MGAEARLPLRAVLEVRAEPGRGLEGDRYWARQGTLWKPEPDREVTLIEWESLETLAREAAVALEPAAARRNLVTRGVRLNDLVGRWFQVGEVTLKGSEVVRGLRPPGAADWGAAPALSRWTSGSAGCNHNWRRHTGR